MPWFDAGLDFPLYLHYFEQRSESEVRLELLQKYIFIPLDIYLKKRGNKDIRSRLEAWLVFWGSDDPEDIVRLIETYPDFMAMYAQIYDICRNVENAMRLFSEELEMLDKNMVKYMMDEMQEVIDRRKEELNQKREELNQMTAELDQIKLELERKNTQIEQQNATIAKLNDALEKQQADVQAVLLRVAQLETENVKAGS